MTAVCADVRAVPTVWDRRRVAVRASWEGRNDLTGITAFVRGC